MRRQFGQTSIRFSVNSKDIIFSCIIVSHMSMDGALFWFPGERLHKDMFAIPKP